jgi:RNA polymerase sigma-70 factor (ECF subfamily)
VSRSAEERQSSAHEDNILCRESLGGDGAAFSKLALKYKKRLFALGFSFFKNPDDTEDFVQDVLVKVYVSLGSFRGESLFSTWLMRIAYNTAVNSVKRRREYTSLAEDFEIADTGSSPEDQLMRSCSRDAILEALGELPEKYRVCVDMFFFYDMPYADISEVTGLPVNTIKSHVFRAKKLLREHLSEGESHDL